MTELTQIYLLLTGCIIGTISLIKTLKNIHNEKIRLYLFSRIILYCVFCIVLIKRTNQNKRISRI